MEPRAPTLPTPSLVVNSEGIAISRQGTYHFDLGDNTDASYNPYMGDTWTRFDGKTGMKTKVSPVLKCMHEHSQNNSR